MISWPEFAAGTRLHVTAAAARRALPRPTEIRHDTGVTARTACAALLLFFSLPANGQVLDAKEIFARGERSVFQVRVTNKQTGEKSVIGSGFVYGRDDLLVTNYHVVSRFVSQPDNYFLKYLSNAGLSDNLQLLAIDVIHDLALLRADSALGPPYEAAPVPDNGARILAMGNPLDLGLTLEAGTNNGLLPQSDDGRILFSGNLNPGMSGGPTFNEIGQVVGVNVATAGNAISFIVPARYLDGLMEQARAVNFEPPTQFNASINRQLVSQQRRFLDGIQDQPWPSTEIGRLRVPGAVSRTIRCWDASSPPKEDDLYRMLMTRCRTEYDLYVNHRLRAGKLLYEYLWLESDQLGPLRFYALYEKNNASQLRSRADKRDVSNFVCRTDFVEAAGQAMKVNLCRRDYVEYPGVSDVLMTAALTGHPSQGFVLNMDFIGTDYDAAMKTIGAFLRQLKWVD